MRAFKIALVESMTIVVPWVLIYGVLSAVSILPWWASLAIWVPGCIATHVWLYATMAGKPSMTDFSLYVRDSGVGMMILLWPLMLSMLIAPMGAQHLLERALGIYWRAGERHFKDDDHEPV